MKILGMGIPELLIILIVILLIFGPKQLPKLGNAIGKTVKGLRDGMASDLPEEEEEYEEVVEEKPAPKKKKVQKRLSSAKEEAEIVEEETVEA